VPISNKLIILISFIIILIFSSVLIGCSKESGGLPTSSSTAIPETAPSSFPTPAALAQSVIAKAIAAMGQLSSFKLGTDTIDQTDTQINGETYQEIIRWLGNKLIDIPNEEEQINTITDTNDASGNFGRFTSNAYFANGFLFTKAAMEMATLPWLPVMFYNYYYLKYLT
jgi:hypothetical protein